MLFRSPRSTVATRAYQVGSEPVHRTAPNTSPSVRPAAQACAPSILKATDAIGAAHLGFGFETHRAPLILHRWIFNQPRIVFWFKNLTYLHPVAVDFLLNGRDGVGCSDLAKGQMNGGPPISNRRARSEVTFGIPNAPLNLSRRISIGWLAEPMTFGPPQRPFNRDR